MAGHFLDRRRSGFDCDFLAVASTGITEVVDFERPSARSSAHHSANGSQYGTPSLDGACAPGSHGTSSTKPVDRSSWRNLPFTNTDRLVAMGRRLLRDKQPEQLAAQSIQHGLPLGNASIASRRIYDEVRASRGLARLRGLHRSYRQKELDGRITCGWGRCTVDFGFDRSAERSERHDPRNRELRHYWIRQRGSVSIHSGN